MPMFLYIGIADWEAKFTTSSSSCEIGYNFTLSTPPMKGIRVEAVGFPPVGPDKEDKRRRLAPASTETVTFLMNFAPKILDSSPIESVFVGLPFTFALIDALDVVGTPPYTFTIPELDPYAGIAFSDGVYSGTVLSAISAVFPITVSKKLVILCLLIFNQSINSSTR